jgi:hypothetical protein
LAKMQGVMGKMSSLSVLKSLTGYGVRKKPS